MSLHRFFLTVPLPAKATDAWPVPLAERDVHHLARVLRLVAGHVIAVVGADGREAEAVLREVTEHDVVADIGAPRSRPAHPRVALAQGLARRERMELAIQKTTELGVSEIAPVAFARSVVKLADERAGKRAERWRRIAEEAAKQSQRTDVPLVREPIDLEGLLRLAATYDIVLVPWEEDAGNAPGIGEALSAAGATAASSVLVVVGPEGGLEPSEVERLETCSGGIRVSLGETILRTETAAVVALALALYELGGLGGSAR